MTTLQQQTAEKSIRDVLSAVQQDRMSIDDAMRFLQSQSARAPGTPGDTAGATGSGQTGSATADTRRTGYISSAGDERTVNNLMRHKYRVLSDVEKRQMQSLKDVGMSFATLLHSIGGTLAEFDRDGDDARQASRELSLAQTKIEEAVMWAVKHVTR